MGHELHVYKDFKREWLKQNPLRAYTMEAICQQLCLKPPTQNCQNQTQIFALYSFFFFFSFFTYITANIDVFQ